MNAPITNAESAPRPATQSSAPQQRALTGLAFDAAEHRLLDRLGIELEVNLGATTADIRAARVRAYVRDRGLESEYAEIINSVYGVKS